MLDVGTSSVFMGGFGHRIFFQIDGLPGYIEISKSGFTGFVYKCVLNNKLVECASRFSKTSNPYFVASIPTVITACICVCLSSIMDFFLWRLPLCHVEKRKLRGTPCKSLGKVIWQPPLCTGDTRLSLANRVSISRLYVVLNGRRFKEFKDLETEIKDFFIAKSIPPLPPKSLKVRTWQAKNDDNLIHCVHTQLLTNHEDKSFVADRKNQLHNFIVAVANDGVIADVPFVQSFLGFPKLGNVWNLNCWHWRRWIY